VSVAVAACVAACADSGGPASRPAKPTPAAGERSAKRACEPTTGTPEPVTEAAAGTPSRVRLGPGMELEATPRTIAAGRRGGERLIVGGVVRDEDCAPLAGATVIAWQTNAAGEYGPTRRGQMRCCYLQATARTDARGRYALHSVVPGGYADGAAHIHMQIGHADAEGIVTELLFAGDSRPRPTGADATTVALERDGKGRRATFDVVLRR
jgi:protocatechuate 3,4-dioxygenase beta subunit